MKSTAGKLLAVFCLPRNAVMLKVIAVMHVMGWVIPSC